MRVLLTIFLIVPSLSAALSFTLLEDADIPGVSFSSLAWGDYNNNGYLDLLITGDTGIAGANRFITRIYRNNGDNSFRLLDDVNLPGVIQGDAVWGDFNNNGLLDIALSGAITTDLQTYITRIYRNNGDGSFSNTNILLPGIRRGVLRWVDYNNNGHLDLFIAGESTTGAVSYLFQNNGNERFDVVEDFEFHPIVSGDVDFIDFNGNGFKDLVITGNNFSGVYLNREGERFELEAHIELPYLRDSSASWGDYNSNGLPDLVISGLEDDTSAITHVYRNVDGRALERQADIELPGIRRGAVLWADMNNNGRRDIVLTGENIANRFITKVYLNSGGNIFTEAQEAELMGVRYSDIAVADINNNGKLDLAVAGMTTDAENRRVANIYLNSIDTANRQPNPPQNLDVSSYEDMIRLSWDRGADEETASNSLTYNVILQDRSNDELLINPSSCRQTGRRRVFDKGNAGYNPYKYYRGIDIGSYRWAVQTIDAGGKGSSFSEWHNFDYMPRPGWIAAELIGNRIHIEWEEVDEASFYRVYGSQNPERRNWEFLHRSEDNRWSLPIEYHRYFLRVTAVLE